MRTVPRTLLSAQVSDARRPCSCAGEVALTVAMAPSSGALAASRKTLWQLQWKAAVRLAAAVKSHCGHAKTCSATVEPAAPG